MTEPGPEESKVVPLFPGQGGGAANAESPVDTESQRAESQDRDDLRREIETLLGEVEPLPPAPHEPQGPEPGHRNAVRCPQCDQYTWRLMQHCIHCDADLVAIAAERADRRRRRWHTLVWCALGASWFVAAGCVYAYSQYYGSLPPKVRGILFLVGGGIIAVTLFLFRIMSADDQRR
jgi:hypothetical protein